MRHRDRRCGARGCRCAEGSTRRSYRPSFRGRRWSAAAAARTWRANAASPCARRRVEGAARPASRCALRRADRIVELPQSCIPSFGPGSLPRMLAVGHGESEILVRVASRDAAPRRPIQKTDLDQKRFVDVFDRVLLFADRGGDRVEADRTAPELVDDRAEQLAIALVESVLVDAVQLQRLL